MVLEAMLSEVEKEWRNANKGWNCATCMSLWKNIFDCVLYHYGASHDTLYDQVLLNGPVY